MSFLPDAVYRLWKSKEAARAADSQMAPGKRAPQRDNVCVLVRPSARAAQAFRTRQGTLLEVVDTGDPPKDAA